jgi:hypothetical protein
MTRKPPNPQRAAGAALLHATGRARGGARTAADSVAWRWRRRAPRGATKTPPSSPLRGSTRAAIGRTRTWTRAPLRLRHRASGLRRTWAATPTPRRATLAPSASTCCAPTFRATMRSALGGQTRAAACWTRTRRTARPRCSLCSMPRWRGGGGHPRRPRRRRRRRWRR